MLSAILGNPSTDAQSINDIPSPMLTQSPPSGQMNNWPSMTPPPMSSGGYPPPLPSDLTQQGLIGTSSTPTSATMSTSYLRTLGLSSSPVSTDSPGMRMESAQIDMLRGDSSYAAGPSDSRPLALPDMLQQQSNPGRPPASSTAGQWKSAGDSVYSQVVTGYDYTQGYHFLMRFLSERSAIPFPFLSRGSSAETSTVPRNDATTTAGPVDDNETNLRGSLEYTLLRPFISGSSPNPLASSSASVYSVSQDALPQESSSSVSQDYSIIDQFPAFSRFEKNDILRVVRALAIFRPSLIALQMPMTEQDEIFVERALQRSLLVRAFMSLRKWSRAAILLTRINARCFSYCVASRNLRN